MAIEYEKTPLGLRVAAYRKWRGFSTAQALADAIPDQRVSKATIVNIEVGRKSDPSISDLLGIAYGLGISPLALLMDVDRLFEPVDMPSIWPGEWAEIPAINVLDVINFNSYLSDGFELLGDPAFKVGRSNQIRDGLKLIALNRAKLRDLQAHDVPGEGVEHVIRRAEIAQAERNIKSYSDLVSVGRRLARVSDIEIPEDDEAIVGAPSDSRTLEIKSDTGDATLEEMRLKVRSLERAEKAGGPNGAPSHTD